MFRVGTVFRIWPGGEGRSRTPWRRAFLVHQGWLWLRRVCLVALASAGFRGRGGGSTIRGLRRRLLLKPPSASRRDLAAFGALAAMLVRRLLAPTRTEWSG